MRKLAASTPSLAHALRAATFLACHGFGWGGGRGDFDPSPQDDELSPYPKLYVHTLNPEPGTLNPNP